jgi:hypothetical protein
MVLGPMTLIKNGQLPRSVRKLEMQATAEELDQLLLTIPAYDRESIIIALETSIEIYIHLRKELFTDNVYLRTATEAAALNYLQQVKAES